jgi:DNA-binding CsgD family transcriptional regulator/tetratricopeptide (TPR) repeat protein
MSSKRTPAGAKIEAVEAGRIGIHKPARPYDDQVDDGRSVLDAGRLALGAGRWTEAREELRQVAELESAPEALFGLGIAEWWLGRVDESLRLWEQAFAGYQRRREPQSAVVTAVYLCLSYRMSLGNEVVAQGWCQRAASLVDEHDLGEVAGWVLVCRAFLANDSGRPSEAATWALEAKALARQYDDIDLELCAMSELGVSSVGRGRVAEGSALLDEAMAAALAGEASDLDTVVLVSCRTLTSCSLGWDIRRAVQWIRTADTFQQRYGSPHLFTTCRLSLGSVLYCAGRWREAEVELRKALGAAGGGDPAIRAQALARLAELRIAQGRLEEAAGLLEGCGDDASGVFPRAVLLLARGSPSAAASQLRRRLIEVDPACMEAVRLAELLSCVELAAGRPAEARRLADNLLDTARDADSDVPLALAERAVGRVLVADNDHTSTSSAVEHLGRAVAAFNRLELPYEAACTKLLLARTLAGVAPEAAVAELRSAHGTLRALGASMEADAAAALLRGLGVRLQPSSPGDTNALTPREHQVLVLLGEGLTNQQIADRLFISRKTVEHHVARVLSKLGLQGRAAAAAYSVRHGSAAP